MSGHSKWSQIKHKKGAADQKKGQLFSKLSKLISIAAKKGADPAVNFELKNTIEKARSFNMPSDNIEKAIKRASDKGAAMLEEIRVEAVGPGSSAFIIEAVTDNRNRTMGELKNILKDYDVKLVHPNSILWMFDPEPLPSASYGAGKKGQKFLPKTPIRIDDQALNEKLSQFREKLDEHDDVKEIYSNIVS